MIFAELATFSAGIFSGAAIYINLVEHPARLECGPKVALMEFVPSYKRAAKIQASLAILASLFGVLQGNYSNNDLWFLSSLLIFLVVPFTLLFIMQTNKKLMDLAPEHNSNEALVLLKKWQKLHMVRSILSLLAFSCFIWLLGS